MLKTKVMKPIQMVDLKSQYEKIKPEIDEAIQEVIDSCTFINGPAVKSFASNLENYLGSNHVIPCANGTDALQIALMALGLQPGDEVITADFTFVATVEVIGLMNLTPVLVDVRPDTFTIDVSALERAITPKTKAIIPVHLYGQCAEMEEIMAIAKKHGLFVVEDAAQAIGADYTFSDGTKMKAGTIGDFGTTSFFPSKNLGCFGDGGALFTNNEDLAKSAKVMTNHGSEVKYYHNSVGMNSRLDSIQAAILNVKLKELDQYAIARQKVASDYATAFANYDQLQTPTLSANSTHVFHQYTIKTSGIDRNELVAFLKSKNVPAMIYYPVPLHLQGAYRDERYKEGDFPITEKLCESVFSLPIHTEMDEDQMSHICSSVVEFLEK